MTRRLVQALLAATLLLLSSGCTVAVSTPTPKIAPTATRKPTATAQAAPLELVILHTNDALGYTEPCG